MRILVIALFLAGCGVHQEDLAAWEGQPVAALDKHPLFVAMPVVRTTASDGTEIRNYVNGREVGGCSGGGSVYRGAVSFATFNTFTDCTRSFAACNNIFYIKNGRVTQYTPVGSGGARCMTDATLRPGYRGAGRI